MARSPEQVVRDFCAAWSRLDIEELLGYFTEDAVYHNMPTKPLEGRDAIRKAIGGFLTGWERTEWELLNVASNGNVVFTERVDRIDTNGRHIELPVAGFLSSTGSTFASGVTTSTSEPLRVR